LLVSYIWLLSKLFDFQIFFWCIAGLFLIIFIILFWIIFLSPLEGNIIEAKKIILWVFLAFFVSSFIAVSIPNKKTFTALFVSIKPEEVTNSNTFNSAFISEPNSYIDYLISKFDTLNDTNVAFYVTIKEPKIMDGKNENTKKHRLKNYSEAN